MGILFQGYRDEFHFDLYFRKIHQLVIRNKRIFSMGGRSRGKPLQHSIHGPLRGFDQMDFPLLPASKKNIFKSLTAVRLYSTS